MLDFNMIVVICYSNLDTMMICHQEVAIITTVAQRIHIATLTVTIIEDVSTMIEMKSRNGSVAVQLHRMIQSNCAVSIQSFVQVLQLVAIVQMINHPKSHTTNESMYPRHFVG